MKKNKILTIIHQEINIIDENGYIFFKKLRSLIEINGFNYSSNNKVFFSYTKFLFT